MKGSGGVHSHGPVDVAVHLFCKRNKKEAIIQTVMPLPTAIVTCDALSEHA